MEFSLDIVGEAIAKSFALANLLLLFLGTAIGVIIGVLPGFGPPLGIALALPFTYYMSPVEAFSLLLGIYSGAMYGGSITAILIGVPGTSPAAATVMDGHPMFKQGRGSDALNTSLIGSVFGGLLSTVALVLVAPFLAAFTIRFGPAEYFALGILGISIIGKVSGTSAARGILMGVIGIFITTVGFDKVTGQARYTFDIVSLYNGIPFIPLLMGLFALPEMLQKVEDMRMPDLPKDLDAQKGKPNWREIWRLKYIMIRSACIGSFVGVLPGGGGDIAAFLSYNEAKRTSPTPEKFGTGMVEGVAAAETANNATVGGALIPALTLGVPGSPATAVLLGAFLIHGLTPGPRLMVDAPMLIYTIFIGLFVINLMLYVIGRFFIRFSIKFVFVPPQIIIPLVLLLCFIGSYAAGSSIYGVWVTVIAGVLGYLCVKLGFPLIPCVLGIVMGQMIETSFRNALIISDGSMTELFMRPIPMVIYIIMFANLFGGTLIAKWRAMRAPKKTSV